MRRRSFITALAGLPIVGLGARVFGLPKPTAKGGITVHGPELIVVYEAHSKHRRILSLRFENVPLRGNEPVREVVDRLQPLFGTVNRSRWQWYGDPEDPPCFSTLPIKKGTSTVLPAGYDVFQPKPGLPWLNIHVSDALARTMMFTDFSVSSPKNGLCSVICAFTPVADRPPWPGSHRPVDFETEILKALNAG
jgi:hypothetical protein